MRISTFWYRLKQGIINICRNILFSLASMATISACIFLFCLFFAIVANVQNVTQVAQSTVGITVFFAFCGAWIEPRSRISCDVAFVMYAALPNFCVYTMPW